MEPVRTSPLHSLSAAVDREWPAIRAARAEAARVKALFADEVRGLVSQDDMSVVVFGSLARDEVTVGSDTDWTLLVDGQASSTHFDVAREIERRVDAFGTGPGREATFGGFAFSHDILHRIGGGEDTNRNLTQRILLLLESNPIGPAEAHDRVLRGVLHRYVTEDAGWDAPSVNVPRFLLNDIARYWRTVAVDFAYKRRARASEGWALRTVKLRLSRKLTFASGLLACFSCARIPAVVGDAKDRSSAMIAHLLERVRLSPLERIAEMMLANGQLDPAARLFDSYDEFLGLLNDTGLREHLKKLAPEDAATDRTYQAAREIGRTFQDALDEIFFVDNATGIPELTRRYGVF